MKSPKGSPKRAGKSSSSTSGSQEPRPTGPTVEEIRLRAFEIYIESGQTDGQDLEHWFQAEKELTEIIHQRQSA